MLSYAQYKAKCEQDNSKIYVFEQFCGILHHSQFSALGRKTVL